MSYTRSALTSEAHITRDSGSRQLSPNRLESLSSNSTAVQLHTHSLPEAQCGSQASVSQYVSFCLLQVALVGVPYCAKFKKEPLVFSVLFR
jgi:hypothetical protein